LGSSDVVDVVLTFALAVVVAAVVVVAVTQSSVSRLLILTTLFPYVR